jgi:hypothetical protein
MKSFFDVLEERFLDVNPYCRSKTIQVYITKLLDLDNKFPKRRQKAADLALRSLQDKSSNVRRNAVRLLARLVGTHPYGALHGGTLRMREWAERLAGVERELGALQPPPGMEKAAVGEETVDPALLDDATMVEGEDDDDNEEDQEEEEEGEDGEPKTPRRKNKKASAATPAGPTTPQVQQMMANSEEISRLQLTRRYYAEAVRFIQTVHDASRLVCQLLGSKNKSEVVEAMDFFRVLDVHKVETAKVCGFFFSLVYVVFCFWVLGSFASLGKPKTENHTRYLDFWVWVLWFWLFSKKGFWLLTFGFWLLAFWSLWFWGLWFCGFGFLAFWSLDPWFLAFWSLDSWFLVFGLSIVHWRLPSFTIVFFFSNYPPSSIKYGHLQSFTDITHHFNHFPPLLITPHHSASLPIASYHRLPLIFISYHSLSLPIHDRIQLNTDISHIFQTIRTFPCHLLPHPTIPYHYLCSFIISFVTHKKRVIISQKPNRVIILD